MAKSTELMTAAYIAAFVGSRDPARVNTGTIARMVEVHPTRVRRIVSKLVKAGILTSSRGGNGGVSLARPADRTTLADIYDAVQESTVLSLGLHDPFSEWSGHCFVHDTFEDIYEGLEAKMRGDLARIRLSEMFKPWRPRDERAETRQSSLTR